MVEDMLVDENDMDGFMLKVQHEDSSNQNSTSGLLFASSDHPDATLHPRLELEFAIENYCIPSFVLTPGESYYISAWVATDESLATGCLLYTSPSPRDS